MSITTLRPQVLCKQLHRNFFAYFRIAFNSVDADRLQKVGADRLCAEWVLKNGGAVTFVTTIQVRDYNALPNEYQKQVIKEIDATGSSIMAIGFEHLKNCNKIERIILDKCKHMETDALEKLIYVKDTLKDLQVSDCYNVEDDGLKSLKQLSNLQKLVVSGLPYIKDLAAVKAELIKNLPNCNIDIQP